MTLGEKILALRTQKEMSQEELAAALEVSRQSVSKWETNQSVPDLDKIIRLADLFGVTVDQLVREGERPEPPEPPEPQVVYVAEGRRGLTGPQKLGVCLEVLGAILLLLGVAALGAIAAVIGAALMILGLPLLLAKKHPWLLFGWLVVGLSLALFNPFTSTTPWGLISALQLLLIFTLHGELWGPAYLVGLSIAMGRGLLTLVLLWLTWRAWRSRNKQTGEGRR